MPTTRSRSRPKTTERRATEATNGAAPAVAPDERFVIHGVDWDTYEKFQAAVGDRPIFLTYNGESLEFMSPSRYHEKYKVLITFLIQSILDELDTEYDCLGSATWKKKDVKRALEADVCFYIQNVEAILDKDPIDLQRDPPPDLAVEIDITRSWLNRKEIYAKLRVPEIWQFDGDTLRVFCLTTRRGYESRTRSVTFPFLDLEEIPELLHDIGRGRSLAQTRAIRHWAKQQVASMKKSGPKGKKPHNDVN